MAYQIESNGDIVINGFQNGIGDTPYAGLTDVKSVNLSSVPGEAAVNFSTQTASNTSVYSNQTLTADSNANLEFQTVNSKFLENGQSILISTTNIAGLIPYAGGTTPLYVLGSSNQGGGLEFLSLGTSAAFFQSGSALSIGTTGTATFSTIQPSTPKFFESMNYGQASSNFMLDSNGRVWTDNKTTQGGTSIPASNSWTYTGNTLNTGSHGNGLVYWRSASDLITGGWDGWLFVFSDGQIDCSNVNGLNGGGAYNHVSQYSYGWNPNTHSLNQTNYLQGANLSGCPHNAIVGPDGNIYYCDYYKMGKIEQFNKVLPTNFSLTTTPLTYVFTNASNLPIKEIATCIAPLGTDFIIGGVSNEAYIWNGVDQLTYSQSIILAESYISNIIAVNTNAYIFCGNRGNIYITNGAQASPWKKVPDHVSGTVEPYFVWGGATYQKNRLYFSVYAEDNAGSALSGYGGVWVVDVQTGAMWLSNELSYGTYSGYATALYSLPPVPTLLSKPTEPAGVGLLIGWDDGSSNYGIDQTISTPYTGGQSYVISDMIPIGTAIQPTTPLQFEFKLSKPLLSGESIQLLAASSLNGTFTNIGTTQGDGSLISANFPTTIQGLQWILLKAILTGKSSSPSYNRLTELRIIGATKQVKSYSSLN